MSHLANSRISPDALTFAGVTICTIAAVVVYFEYRAELLCFWVGAVLFVIGSVLDILGGIIVAGVAAAFVHRKYLRALLVAAPS